MDPFHRHFRTSNFGGRARILAVFGLMAACLGMGASFARAAGSDEAFVAGLRDRQLFSLAVSYCQRRLQDPSLTAKVRAELVVELSQTLVEQALNASPASAVGLWQQAVEETSSYVQRFPDPAWAVVVRTQAGLVLLARGEMLRQQAEVAAQGETLLSEARAHLRLAITQLRAAEEDLAVRLRDTRLPPAGNPTRDQLLALQKNLRYQLARAYLSQGQCYPAETPDRDNALRQAIELLRSLAQLTTVDPLAWKARLDEAKCLRLMKDRAGASRKLDALAAEDPPPAIAIEARALRLRVLLDAGQLAEAQTLVQLGRAIAGVSHAEWDFALLEYCLAQWNAAQQAKDATAATRWQTAAAELTKQIETDQSPYWARRAEALLASRLNIGSGSTDLDLKVRAAAGLYRSGQWQDAVAAYESAAATARESSQAERAFELDYAAAAIVHEQNQHLEAATKLRRLSLAQPQNRQAPEAHLLALFHAGQALKTEELSLRDYGELVREHLQRWPESPSAAHANIYLGNLLLHERNWHGAVKAYAAVPPDHAEFAAAVAGAERAYRLAIAAQKSDSQPHETTLQAAADYFERLVLGSELKWPATWTAAQRQAALAAARLRLEQSPPDYDRAERMLAAAQAGQPSPAADWLAAATAESAVALAGLGRFKEAEARLLEAGGGDPQRLLDRLEQLSQLSQNAADAERRQSLAQLQLSGVQQLAGSLSKFSEHDQFRYQRLQAQALADSGDNAQAARLFQKLLEENPRDGEIHEAYAQCLTDSKDKAHWEQARALWRDIERKSRPGVPRWFRAKYGLAVASEKLGEKEYAARLIKVTAVLHPDLGGAEMKPQFEALLKRCEGG